MKKILVAEDEAAIREFIVINLKRNGYDVTDTENGEKALEAYYSEGGDFDIVLLDIMMPGIDGLEVCKQIRQDNNNIGIIMLTAKTQEIDKITGLIMGADDYVTKPFSPSELMARVDALYRRVGVIRGDSSPVPDPTEYMLCSGDFVLNLRSRTLTRRGVPIELTQVEFQIMEYFLLHPDQPLDRNDILAHVWGDNYVGDEKVVDVNVRRLRMKIENDPSTPRHLTTVWGMGYKWIK
ncbi:MAG: response regulator transcription factor [Oscillospiraceae bacterium]|nr:response regulator transcription factor [Oscillospiraceae bacterium]